MTKHLLLALALTLGTAAVAVPPASACGGYGRPVESAEHRAVREAVLAVTQPRYGGSAQVYVTDVRTDGNRATATVQILDEGRNDLRQVTLRLRDGSWRILAFS